MTSPRFKVSVIMAEYNTSPEYLNLAIQSVLSQTFRSFEFIIVDDGGSNDLQSIVDDFNDDRIRVIKNGGNKGFVYSLNNAISHSNGEYLVRMDTDDIISENRIEVLYKFISTHPEYDVVSSRAMEFSEDEEYGAIGKPGEKSGRDIMRGDVPVHAAAIMRRSAIEQVGGYKERYVRAEDLALWCDMILAGKRLYMLNDILYMYRVNPGDYKKRTLRHRKGEIAARLHYYPRLGAGPVEYVRILKSIVAGVLPTGIVRLYRNMFIADKRGL